MLKAFRKKDLAKNPYEQFEKWMNEAIEAEVLEPNAMALATAKGDAVPSNRMVLLKFFDEKGLVFFTNYSSRKALELQENPKASAVFFWKEIERQVSVEGAIEKILKEESESYFKSRPRLSQIAALASKQDAEISSREALEKSFQEILTKYQDQELPAPANWGGFRLIPCRFEFWQGRENRLHDRLVYLLSEKQWVIKRLSP